MVDNDEKSQLSAFLYVITFKDLDREKINMP